jgi:hypothetical protein
MKANRLPLHEHAQSEIAASALSVFDYIDRPERLSAHMERRSWRMGWGTMAIATDASGGRSIGSHWRLAGRMLGLHLAVEGNVVERQSPNRKVWETVGEPRLLVIGPYRMEVTIAERRQSSFVTIAIDYALPQRSPGRWLGSLFNKMYARWCVDQMMQDLKHRFET